MSGRRVRLSGRAPFAVGVALIVFGGFVLGMLPASASAPSPTTLPPVPAAAAATTPAAGLPVPEKRTTTTVAPTTTTSPPHTPVTGGIVACPAGDPAGDTCANLPCPSTDPYCGSVVAGPTSDLGPGQYVYLDFSGFDPGDSGITIYYCADPGASTTLSSAPLCAVHNTTSYSDAYQEIPIYPASASSILPAGTSTASIQAAEVSAPSDPIAGSTIHTSPAVDGNFYCDGTTANPCAIVITDASITPGHPVSSTVGAAANSVVIPLNFRPEGSGCPNASVVSTESEFGIDTLMPELARLSCAENAQTAIIPFETATDGLHAVTDLAAGVQQIAFTDDPEAADQQAQLKKGSFALIPVALSANVVAFFAQLYSGQLLYTLDQMDLTPTMAAGLLTNAYNDAATTDDQDACSGPSLGAGGNCLFGPGPCFGLPTCSLYSQLNFVDGFDEFDKYQSVERSDTAGATAQLFTWLCSAPVVPLDFGTDPVESMSGAQELEAGLSPAPSQGPPVTTCPASADQVPAIPGTPEMITVNDPSQQALKADQAVFASGTSEPVAAFADMNWAESRYYGMNVAALQNAAGQFVTPTAASLDAAVGDATVNADGSLTPRNLASDPAAYPMPSIIYAAVSTAPQSQAAATAITTLLSELLQLTGGSDTADLPAGFVPLPANLMAAATKDVADDIHVVAPTPTTTTVPATGTTEPTEAGFGDTGSSGYENFFSSSSAFDESGAPGSSELVAPTSSTAAGDHPKVVVLGPALPGYVLASSDGRVVVPVAVTVGVAAVVLGAFLISSGFVVRRRARRATVAGAAEAAGAPGPEGDDQ